ncbi:MAG: 2-amino-4-hydroxy-6-hydroxymethyldihydropteridine diphosphokinase, partial [Planctomycetota bacterium]
MKAALGLGSNLGDRKLNLDAAVEGLAARGELLAVSRFHETEPAGGPPQGPFLNAAVVVSCDRSPRALLELAHALRDLHP